jgi:Tol biopolymer transport system component
MKKYIVAALILLSSCKKDDVADTTVVDMTPINAKGEILFISSSRISRNADWKLCSISADGTNQKLISNTIVCGAQPILSNSKTRIAFTTYENGYYCLYVVNKDGQNQKLLSKGKFFCGEPAWSPDDSQLVFVKNGTESGEVCDIFLIQADGSNEIRLTKENTNLTNVNNNFSPGFYENNSIVFSSSVSSRSGIYRMNIDGSNKQLLTPPNISFAHPVISRDRSRIAISSLDVAGGRNVSQIFIMEAESNILRQITFSPLPNAFYIHYDGYGGFRAPVWSPDGEKLAYMSYENGSADIFVVNADGTRNRRLTNTPFTDEYPHWTADGNYILFSSDRDRSYKIYIMRAEGQLQTAVTNLNPEDTYPSFIGNP